MTTASKRTLLPQNYRPKCPCPVTERAFERIEALTPFPEDLVNEAKVLGDCPAGSQKQREQRAAMFVRSALSAVAGPDLALEGFDRLAAIRGSVAFAQTLLDAGRLEDAVVVAIDCLAASVGLRRGDEDGQRAHWETIVGHVASARRIR